MLNPWRLGDVFQWFAWAVLNVLVTRTGNPIVFVDWSERAEQVT